MVTLRSFTRERRGYMLLDCLAALALLSMGVFVSVRFFRTEVREIRYSHDRLAVLLIAQSEVERLHAIPFDRIVLGENQPLELALPSAERIQECTGRLSVVAVEPGLKEATVRIEWLSPKGVPRHVTASSVFCKESGP